MHARRAWALLGLVLVCLLVQAVALGGFDASWISGSGSSAGSGPGVEAPGLSIVATPASICRSQQPVQRTAQALPEDGYAPGPRPCAVLPLPSDCRRSFVPHVQIPYRINAPPAFEL